MKQRQGLTLIPNTITFLATFLILLIYPFSAFSQVININYVNTDNYPVMEAGFTATNSYGLKIYNSTVNDFAISENNRINKILEVTNPQQDYQSVSLIFMVDISLSMEGRKLELVKNGLLSFIDQIPLETSEIALACFSDEAYVYTDFTQNRSKLVTALNKLHNVNGTNFNNAFLDPLQGAFNIGKSARNKKTIVFVTDGLGTTNAEQISSLAIQQEFTVYTLNVELAIPDDLKTITLQTGGQYYEKIFNPIQFKTAASSILRQLKCTGYGTVKWLSTLNCELVKPVLLKYKNATIEMDYDVPANKIGKIEVNPSLLQFGNGKIGLEQSQDLIITSHNIPIAITGVEIDDTSFFTKSDTIKIPRQLKSGESLNTKIKFLARDAGIYNNNIKITSDVCPDMEVNIKAGSEEHIKLLFPKGGEIFTVGEDTSIIWEGVKRTQPVEMNYRLAETDSWKYISTSANLNYLWNLPIDTSKNVQVKITPVTSIDENLEISAIIYSNNNQILNTFYSNDGSKIITTDKDGFVKTWDTQTGKIISSLGGYDAKKSIFATDDERLFLFLKDETFVWNVATDKLSGRVSHLNKKVKTSLILPDGYEVLLGGNVSSDPAKNSRIWSGISSFKSFLFNEPDLKWTSFTPDGQIIVSLDNKNTIKIFETDSARLIKAFNFKELITEIIISPDGTKALIRLPQEICMLDLENFTELYRISKTQYQQFTPTGKFFIVEDINKSLIFIESSTGKSALSMIFPRFYEVSPSSNYVIYNRQDSLYLFDFKKKKNILALSHKPIRLVNFDNNDTKVYALTLNNSIEIYETATGSLLGVIEGFSRKIKELICNPVKPQLTLIMDDNRLEVWSPSETKVTKESVSGKFTISSPRPSVIDTIRFDEQIVNSVKELNIQKFVLNDTKFPVIIKGIEISGNDFSDFEVVSKYFPQKIEKNSQLPQEFRFKPSLTGIRKAVVLTLTATDTFSTVIIGNGIQQQIQLFLRHLNFDKVKVGEYKDTLASILINKGKDTLLVSRIKNSGPDEEQFTILTNQVYKILPGDTLKLIIRFNPKWRGKTTTALTFPTLSQENRIIVRGEGIASREIILKGTSRDIADSSTIEARVMKIDLGSDKIMEELKTGSDGKFQFHLLADRNFGIIAEKENFISTSLNFDLSESVSQDTINQDIYLTELKPGAIIRFNCIFFEFDKATFLPGSQPDLQRLLGLVKKYSIHSFEIHGHTDSIGTETYNINLSKARAEAVLNYLVKNGASKEKLTIKYFGKSKPVSTNETEQGRALNRRVELKVIK